jgi:TfoX/Sxy family transcriptional regulator of competence genes
LLIKYFGRHDAKNAIQQQNLGSRPLVCTENSETLYKFIYAIDEFAEDNKEELEER